MMDTTYKNDMYRKVHFAVMAIEASAKKSRMSGQEMHDRLKKQDLIHQKDASQEYDIVEGGVANDNVIDTVEDYEKGVILPNKLSDN